MTYTGAPCFSTTETVFAPATGASPLVSPIAFTRVAYRGRVIVVADRYRS